MIGILGLQGDFAAHGCARAQVGVAHLIVKKPAQLAGIQGLIIPGGESTTLLKLMESYDYWSALEAFVATGKPVLGTCAGLILLAREVLNPPQASLGCIDITVERNSYGRQRESFEAVGQFRPEEGEEQSVHMVFIRAPRILRLGPEVQPLATCGDDCVMARQDNIVVASFHPELSGDTAVHAYFDRLVV